MIDVDEVILRSRGGRTTEAEEARLTYSELESRAHIFLEKFNKQVSIEAETMITMDNSLMARVKDGTVEWWGHRDDMPAVLAQSTIVGPVGMWLAL